MANHIHKVHYYETDRMSITHHSNYIRWMEEAREVLLEELGYGYLTLERDGITSPVVTVECKYLVPTTYNDEINIEVTVEEYSGVRVVFGYVMTNTATGDVVLTGSSSHCFIDRDNKPVIVKKHFPELDTIMRKLAGKGKE